MKLRVFSLVGLVVSASLWGCASTVSPPEAATKVPAPSLDAGSSADGAQAPTLHEGDTWVDDLGAGVKKEMVIRKVGANTLTTDQWGSTQVTDLAENPTEGYQWSSNQGDFPLPFSYKPAVDFFDYPLYPGKTWSQHYQWKEVAGTVWGNGTCEGKVVGWETVTVPAGTFKALRVDVITRGVNFDYDLTYWYSPDVSRFVKLTTSTGFKAELVSYHPAGATRTDSQGS